MENRFLSARTTRDINKQIAKILRDLGNPEPPLRLEEVRELLRLDREYYSSGDEGFLQDVVHNIKVAGKQIIKRPSILAEAIKAGDLKALFLPDRKRILIDQSQPQLKWRWYETHEIVHGVLPWHGLLMFGDTQLTVTPACYEQTETEANYGAGRLLFLGDTFNRMIRDTTPSIEIVKSFKKTFGNTITNTLWRYVEESEKKLIGIVSDHPHFLTQEYDPEKPCRYFIRSKSFAEMFPNVTEKQLFGIVRSYCSHSKAGPLGSSEAVLRDARGEEHIFLFETFGNTYDVLTLGVCRSLKPFNITSLDSRMTQKFSLSAKNFDNS